MKQPFDDAFLLIGKITVLWSRIEHHFERIIWCYTDAEARIGHIITGLLGNVSKSELLLRLAENIEGDEDIYDRLEYLVYCYNICRENRNIVIHGLFEDSESGDPIMLKSRKTGGLIIYPAEITRLEKVADQIASTYEYCRALDNHVWSPYVRDLHAPLPNKPQKPHKLAPLQRQGDHPTDWHPLGPSPG